MNYLVLQHFSRPPRAAIANAILIPAKVQSHKLEHKGKLEISLPHHGEMVLCCARSYRSDSIRETVSDKLVHLSSLSPKRSCHSDPRRHPPGSAHLCFGIGTTPQSSSRLTPLPSVLRTEVKILERCFSGAWMVSLIRVDVLGNGSGFDGARYRSQVIEVPPVVQVWGLSYRCVWGKRDLRKSFWALTPGWHLEVHNPSSFDACGNFSPYFSSGQYFLTSDFTVLWIVLRAKTLMGQSGRLFHFI